MIPLQDNPKGDWAPQLVERGLIVYNYRDISLYIDREEQIGSAYKVCSPTVDWKRQEYTPNGRNYRIKPKSTLLPFLGGKVLVKALERVEGKWVDITEVPEARKERVYREGKYVQWCGPPPVVFHPNELRTAEQFLAGCSILRKKLRDQENLEFEIKQFDRRFEMLGFGDVSVTDNGDGDVRILCSYADVRKILSRMW